MRLILEFIRNEDGATAIEYCMIGAVVSVALIAGATLIGTSTNTSFSKMGSALQ